MSAVETLAAAEKAGIKVVADGEDLLIEADRDGDGMVSQSEVERIWRASWSVMNTAIPLLRSP